MASWISYIIFTVIAIGILIAIGLTIYSRILEVKKDKKQIEGKEDKK